MQSTNKARALLLRLTTAAIAAFILVAPGVALANQYGQLRISSDTTLTDHRYGAVVFDADGITLDCNWKMVHISSFTPKNCTLGAPSGLEKCGIVADGRANITIKRCNVIGAFDHGVFLRNTEAAKVEHTQAAGATTGFTFTRNRYLTTNTLLANSSGVTGVVIDNDTHGFYTNTTVGTSGYIGIDVLHANGSTLSQVSVAYAQTIGLWVGRGTLNTVVDGASIEMIADGPGIVLDGSGTGGTNDGFVLTNSVVRWAAGQGLGVYKTVNSYFGANIIENNGCDAYQDSESLGNTWTGNSFTCWAGTVPANH
jgi:hypothetical protein